MEKLNGVDMTVIQKLVTRYQQHPNEAITNFSSIVKWKDGFHTQVKIGDHAPISIDEPKWLAGLDVGPNPVEILLGALGACMSVGFIANASSQGVEVNSMEVEISGDIDLQVFFGLREGNSGFDEITVKFKVNSNADQDKLQNILSKVSILSPVKNTLERNVRLETSLN